MKLQWPQTWIERISRRSESERVTLRFKDYSLTIVAICDENTGTYSPLVQIIWTAADGKQSIRSLILPDQCFSAEEALSWRFAREKHGPIDALSVESVRLIPMKITQVKIARIDGPHLLGFAEVTFDDSFSVGDFLIFREPTGYRIVMPRVKLQNGIYQEIVSPLDPTTQKMIDDAVIGEYEKVAGKFSRRRKKRIYWPTSPGGSKPADTPISDALAAPQTSKSFVVVLLAIIKSLGAPERPVDTLTIVGIIVCLILEVLVIIGFFKS